MKRNVIVFGLISGLIITAFMVVSTAMCYKYDNFQGSMLLGYAAMLLSFSLIFVGIKNFRDKYNNGVISFGKAFKIGLYIALIASTMYVVVWLIDYYLFVPDFMDKYVGQMLKNAKASGASATEMNQKAAEMASYKEMYKNPLLIVLLTYAEILPVGLIVSVISALILKRRSNNPGAILSTLEV